MAKPCKVSERYSCEVWELSSPAAILKTRSVVLLYLRTIRPLRTSITASAPTDFAF